MVSNNWIVQLENISFIRKGKSILDSVNLKIAEGNCAVMLGPNGSGKSTIAGILCFDIWPTLGTYYFGEHKAGWVQTSLLRKQMGVFQPRLFDMSYVAENLTALDIICTGHDGKLNKFESYPMSVLKRAMNLYAKLSTKQLAQFDLDQSFGSLSAGEQRKVLLLRLFMNRHRFYIFDEPYESLDIPSKAQLEAMIVAELEERKAASLFIVHRYEEIPSLASQAILLKAGRTEAIGAIEEVLTSENTSRVYGWPLIVRHIEGRYYCVLAS